MAISLARIRPVNNSFLLPINNYQKELPLHRVNTSIDPVYTLQRIYNHIEREESNDITVYSAVVLQDYKALLKSQLSTMNIGFIKIRG